LAEVEPSESAGELTPSPPTPLRSGDWRAGDLDGLPERILHTALAAYDRENGGFGGAPKFHHADVLELILAVAHRTGDEALADIVRRAV
jgi:uncharacterized protein YyaL (SSP411 family)